MQQTNIIPYPVMQETPKTEKSRHIRYLNILSKIAADIVNPSGGNARLAACLVYKGDIISFGINERKSHPFQAKYGKNKEAVFLHAETSAIKNALRNITPLEIEKSTLYICRVKFEDFRRKKMIFGLSKPCTGCIRCINTFNIRNVIFSLDNGDFGVL